MRNSVILMLFFLSALFVSCDANGVFDQYESVSNPWNKEAIVQFKVQAPDTTSAYNLFVNLRNNQEYKYNNLFLIVEMNFPHGKTVKDTLEYKMAKPNGEFLGTGFSSIKENKLWYKENFIFSETGEYQVNIQHAMRENGKVNGIVNLQGITDVGFRVEKINNK
ncbi:gliding motility lipoprotein GldH [Lacinutrix sp. C3R15]|uniref:gliding motility lipoprotein GldH n=1 Tax=Flavobacteriaceae TaxID=49546 RepID=UPI001C0A616C|nr:MULTISPECIES: gliding motility lipoprotein GldH [Flavobacteriaceae]MBU2938112.1 gliding motility lipoprotein GldH [Lacinutrix sp. C3R15]MDO6621426.1 gliding motility lipoprotein GldH [Oceanihabitans sp. 1_MG-2023]